VSRLEFMSPVARHAVSPLRHIEGVIDVSHLGKLEVRGGIPDGAIPIGVARALVVVDGDPRAERDRLLAEGYRVYDMTSALAALEVQGDALMRRLTELDLDALPAVGSILRGTPAVIERREGDRFRLFVPQELGQFVAETVVDLAAGL
jgi:hypothetical protein